LTTFFLYILTFGCIALGVLNYLNIQKLNNQNLKLRILSKQNKEFAAQLNNLNKPADNLKVYYHPTSHLHGEITSRTSLYLSPTHNSPVIRILHGGIKLQIVDLCETYDTLWYEVKVITDEIVNIKGFVKKNFVKELDTIETSLVYKNNF